jgi:hypothetical protein
MQQVEFSGCGKTVHTGRGVTSGTHLEYMGYLEFNYRNGRTSTIQANLKHGQKISRSTCRWGERVRGGRLPPKRGSWGFPIDLSGVVEMPEWADPRSMEIAK